MNSSTNPVDIRADHLEIVRDILSAHLPAGFQFWVFGSRATWTTKDSSDLDLAVAGPSRLDHRTMADLEIAFEESDLPYTVDVVDLNAISPEFREIVKSQKVLLLPNRGRLSTHREWREASLGEVIELKRGYDLPQRNRIPGNAPVVSSAGITDWHSEAKVKGPGVVTGRYGTLGEIYFIEDDFWPLNTALYVRDFKGNDPKFVSYFLSGLDFFAFSDKAAVPGLNRNHLHEAVVRYPTDIREQRAIAHILGTLDDKIELNRRMNHTLEEMARAIFQDWFVDFGPVRAKLDGREPYLPPDLWSLFPDRLVDSELGEIPEGWRVRSVEDVASVVGGSTPSTKVPEYWNGGINCWATPKDLSGLSVPVLLDTERKITESGLGRISSGLLPTGTVLLSSRAPIGYFAINEIPTAVNQGFIAMSPKPPVSNLFLLNWCATAVDDIVSHANGSTFLEVSKSNFRQISLVVPPYPLMESYHHTATNIHRKMVDNEYSSRTLNAQRNALLPKLVSGEVRICKCRQPARKG